MTVMSVSGKFAQAQSGSGGAAPSAGSQSSSGGSSSAFTSQAQTQMSPINVSQLSVSGVDTSDLGLGPLSSAQVASGRSLTSADATSKVALVTKAYAKQNSLAVGDTKKIDGKKFTIVGIVALPAGSTSSDVYIPLSWAQKLSDNTGKVNQIYVKADSANDIAAVKTEIKAAHAQGDRDDVLGPGQPGQRLALQRLDARRPPRQVAGHRRPDRVVRRRQPAHRVGGLPPRA